MANGRVLETWIEYIQSVHFRSVDLSLDRMQLVMESMNLTQWPYQVITIAGTNGKGSCVALLEATICCAGLSVGSYTSPHLVRYNERIRINRKSVDDAAICTAFENIEKRRNGVPLTYFEFSTLAALEIFRDFGLDVLILEVGLGGRLDAVNCVDADVAVISSIGLDHTDWLGPDLESIAKEKAGIFRSNQPVVCAQPNPPNSLIDAAHVLGSKLLTIDVDFGYQKGDNTWRWWVAERHNSILKSDVAASGEAYSDLPFPAIPGNIQVRNAAAIITALNFLPLRPQLTRSVLVQALNNCELPGRLQQIPGPPKQIFDVAHNQEAIQVLGDFLEIDRSDNKTYAVFAILRDKPVTKIIQQLKGVIDVWHVAELQTERSASAQYLVDSIVASSRNCDVHSHETVLMAYHAAMGSAGPQDRVVIFGSFFTVGAIMQYLEISPYT